ncbi:nucleoside monophosphate kinase [Scytonema hofmannii FACHB-248]|uniref:Adenylate kinase n=1 Tax=Scytonema hofmannii FACHB-248 TaxID=1842502 RepID=A0ABR8GMR4_9CYAN|nr:MULTISPECIES: nucleoside monophosphate kinase [Nostocales]MBD2604710.1 nucleoside monophosphate kinase [Scytonema hofmannii FACHB-248]
MKFVILGGSGSGKSTQAQRLCRHFDIPLISTGEILREALTNLSSLGREVQPYLEKGELVPDETMIDFIRTRLNKDDINSGWVLEGYPRTAFQAEELDFLLEDLQQKLDWAIYLQVPEAVMVTRSLGRSLPDDQPEIVQRRIELFYDRTMNILEYYDRRRRLLTINGDQLPDMVEQNILTLLCVP